MKHTNKIIGAVTTALAVAGIAIPAFAQTINVNTSANVGVGVGNGQAGLNASTNANFRAGMKQDEPGEWRGQGMGMGMMKQGEMVLGTVSAINGTTLTISTRFGKSTTTSTYAVDASAAKVFNENATSSLSSIKVGQTVLVEGTISGSNVTAKVIRYGMMMKMGDKPLGAGGWGADNVVKGNGEPVVAGKVSSISGNSMTITNSSNATYTVDISTAVISKNHATSTASSINTGDYVIVQGSVNGNSIVASSVVESSARADINKMNNPGMHLGFMSSIGNFFKKIFGF